MYLNIRQNTNKITKGIELHTVDKRKFLRWMVRRFVLSYLIYKKKRSTRYTLSLFILNKYNIFWQPVYSLSILRSYLKIDVSLNYFYDNISQNYVTFLKFFSTLQLHTHDFPFISKNWNISRELNLLKKFFLQSFFFYIYKRVHRKMPIFSNWMGEDFKANLIFFFLMEL